MAIYQETTGIETIKLGDDQIDKITLGDTTIWENWVEWSDSASASVSSSGDSVTLDTTGKKLTSVYFASHRYYVSGEYCWCYAYAYYNGAWNEVGRSQGSSGPSVSWTVPESINTSVTSLKATFTGQISGSNSVEIQATGFQKPN